MDVKVKINNIYRVIRKIAFSRILIISVLYTSYVNAQDGYDIMFQNGHNGRVKELVFSNSNKYLISGGDDGIVLIIDVKTGIIVKRLQINTPINKIKISKDDTKLYIKDNSSGLHIFEWKKDSLKKIERVYNEFEIFQDTLLLTGENAINLHGFPSKDNIYFGTTYYYNKELEEKGSNILNININKHNFSVTRNNRIQFYKLPKIDFNNRYENFKLKYEYKFQKNISLNSFIRVHSNDSIIYLAEFKNYSKNKIIRIYVININNDELKNYQIELPTTKKEVTNRYEVYGLDVNINNKLLAVSFWDANEKAIKTVVWDFESEKIINEINNGGILSISNDGSILSIGNSEGRINFYDLNFNSLISTLEPFNKDYGIESVKLNPTKPIIATTYTYAGIDLWDLSKCNRFKHISRRSDAINDEQSMGFSHNGNKIAYFDNSQTMFNLGPYLFIGTPVKFYNIENDDFEDSITIYENNVDEFIGMSFSYDDKYFNMVFIKNNRVVASRWNFNKNSWVKVKNGFDNKRKVDEITLKIKTSKITSNSDYKIAFSGDGELAGVIYNGNNTSRDNKNELEIISYKDKISSYLINLPESEHFKFIVFNHDGSKAILTGDGHYTKMFLLDVQKRELIQTDLECGGLVKFIQGTNKIIVNNNSINEDFHSCIIDLDSLSITPTKFKNIQKSYSIDAKRNILIECGKSNLLNIYNFAKQEKIATIYTALKEGEYLFFTPELFYNGSKYITKKISIIKSDKAYPIDILDLFHNRPDIVLSRLGYADSTLIKAYHRAYLKRLKKMGFKEEDLNGDIHIPETKIKNLESLPIITDTFDIDLNLYFEDSKYKLDRINVWINDVAVYGTNGIDLRAENTSNINKDIKLELAPGENKIQVSCLNQKGAESYKETINITYKPKQEIKPNLFLITIGASKYKDANYNLTYASKDAQDVASLFAKSEVYEKVITKTLTNKQVTKENIEALRTFLNQAGINDEVMIFIAGHGVLDENLDYFFASYDMDFNNPSQRGIAYEDLEGLLDGIKPLKKVLLIDACHSGEIDKEEVELLAAADVQEGEVQFRAVGNTVKPKLGMQNTSELTKALFTDLRKGTGATVISSAGGGEYAMESGEWKNGLFTYCLIKGIKTKAADLNGDGEIWLKELQEYVQTQVTELSGGKQQPTSRIENSVLDYRVW
jgi:WD40 repeat protein/uncharacterized caspase-like protein